MKKYWNNIFRGILLLIIKACHKIIKYIHTIVKNCVLLYAYRYENIKCVHIIIIITIKNNYKSYKYVDRMLMKI